MRRVLVRVLLLSAMSPSLEACSDDPPESPAAGDAAREQPDARSVEDARSPLDAARDATISSSTDSGDTTDTDAADSSAADSSAADSSAADSSAADSSAADDSSTRDSAAEDSGPDAADAMPDSALDEDGGDEPVDPPCGIEPPPPIPCAIDSGFPGDSLCIAPPAPADGFQIHIGPTDYNDADQINQFVFGAGRESSQCFNFHTPNAESVAYLAVEVRARPGTFHSTAALYATELTDGGWHGCRDPGTGTNPDLVTRLLHSQGLIDPAHTIAPENAGLGNPLEAHMPGQLEVHAYNTTGSDLLREAWINVYLRRPEDVSATTRPVRLMGGLTWSFLPIPPETDQVYVYDCPISSAGRILSLTPHVHAHNRRITAYLRSGLWSTKIFEETDWTSRGRTHFDSCTQNPDFGSGGRGAVSGPLAVQAGDVLRWECHIVNDSTGGLHYTNEVQTGEMCNLMGESTGASLHCVQ